jgi:lysozyme
MFKRFVAGGVGAVLAASAAFIAPWEGLETEAYLDPVGIPTVCYGETRGVEMGDSYTPAQCLAMLQARVGEFHKDLTRCIPTLPTLPNDVQVAFLSWSYNVGIGAACRSTLARKANSGDLKGACNELPRWRKAGGRVLRGLERRRAAEQQICLEALQ